MNHSDCGVVNPILLRRRLIDSGSTPRVASRRIRLFQPSLMIASSVRLKMNFTTSLSRNGTRPSRLKRIVFLSS